MADMYFDVDTALTEVPVNLMPLLDDTDFKTRKTAVAYNAAGMDLVWNFVTSAGVFTQTAVTPTTAGNYDWTHQGDGMYTIEIPASGGASINNDTEGYGWFTGVATGVLPWRGPVIGFRAAALNNALLDGGDNLTVLISAGTGTGQLDISSGKLAWNAAWDAEVQSEVEDGLIAQRLDHLLATSVAGTDVADDSIFAKLVSSAATADWDTFVNTTDALQAIRDRGDAAWTTGGGGSITDIISWTPLIPYAIDLANTKTYRLGVALTNALDDLPTTVEITPGTISIDRAANGGTSWTAVVTDAAMSEIAGLVYYDEVFDTASTYAAGDVLRITFKDTKVTVSANDYELFGSTGRSFYTGIIATTPAVNVTQIDGDAGAAATLKLFTDVLNSGTGQIQAGTLATDTITATKIQDGALTAAKVSTSLPADIVSISGDSVAADNLEAYTDGTTPMPVNATQISGDSVAADNLEAALDGTGGVTIDAAIEVRSTGGSAGHNAADLVSALLTTAMSESYATDGAAPTLAQAVLAIQQFLFDKDLSGTTLTVRGLDGTTGVMTFTLDSGTTPTDINRTA